MNKKSLEIIHSAFNRKKSSFPSYSRSALARDCGVSTAFMSNIFTGKKVIPSKKFDAFCRCLELDSTDKAKLASYLIVEKGRKSFGLASLDLYNNQEAKTPKRSNSPVPATKLAHWYYLAVLEALATQSTNSISKMAEKLKITQYQFENAMDFLRSHQLIHQANGVWVKKNDHIFFPVGKSKKDVRNFHKQMMQQALVDLNIDHDEARFKKRMYTSYTFSANKNKIEEIKVKLQKLLSEITESAGEGECSEVYQCNLQFFPLLENL